MTVIRKATRSLIWLFAETWLTLVWGIIQMAIMARLLGPDVFGLLALAGACLGVGSIFLSDALTEGLQQFDELRDGHSNAAFWLNTCLSISFVILICLLAGPLAALFKTPIIAQVLPVMAVIGLIGMLSDVPEALLERDLEHQKLVILDNVIGVPTSLLTIGLALYGFGIWSIVLGGAVATLASTIALFWVTKWRPGLSFSRQDWRDVTQFARDTIALKCLAYADDALPRFTIMYFLGERALGLYSIALNLAGQFSGLLMGPLSEVAMAVVARLQNDLAQVKKTLSDVYALTTFIMYPAVIGAALLAPLVTPLLLGPQWSGIEVPLIIALLIGLRHATGDFNIAILRGLGDTRSPLISLAVGIVIFAVFIPFALPFGLIGLISLVAIRVFATWPLTAWFVKRRCGYPVILQFTIGWRSLAAALIMAACVIAVMQTAWLTAWPVWAQLIAFTTLGIAIYSSLYVTLWPKRLRGGLSQLVEAIRGDEDPDDDAKLELSPAAL